MDQELSPLEKWSRMFQLQTNILIGEMILAVIFDYVDTIEKEENAGGYIP